MRNPAPAPVLAALMLLTGCGGGGDAGGSGPSPPPANAAPVFGNLAFSVNEDTDLGGRAGATDAENGVLTYGATSSPANGTLVEFNTVTGDFLYRPGANYSGADSFAVRVVDPAGNAASGTVSLTVAGVNDAPQATPASLDTDTDAPVNGAITATDVEPGALNFAQLTNASHGVVSNLAAGAFTYTPNPAFTGVDSFTVRVSDADGASTDVTVTISVNPGLVYSGAAGELAVTDENHARAARSAWIALKFLIGATENALLGTHAAGVVDTTVNGTSGSVRYTGTLQPDGTGRLVASYSQFRSAQLPGITLDGIAWVDIQVPMSATQGRVRVMFRTLTHTSEELEARLGGWIQRQDSGTSVANRDYDVTGSVVVHETGTGVQRWFTAIDVRRRRATQSWRDPNNAVTTVNAWSGEFRAYDARDGFVRASFEPSLNFMRPESWAGLDVTSTDLTRIFGIGSLVISGSTSRKLWLTAVSPNTFAIETNTGGGTQPDRSLAYRWEADFSAPAGADTHGGVWAVATPPFDRGWAETGRPFRPEGRFSEHGGGGFVTQQWQKLIAPLGSTAQITDPSSLRPSFTADRSGFYLFKLSVSDGANVSTDYLAFEAAQPNTPPVDFSSSGVYRNVHGSQPRLEVNEEFALDGRRSYTSYYSSEPSSNTPPRNWRVTRNDLSGVEIESVLFSQPTPVARFSPTVPGYYRATHADTQSHANPDTRYWFSVGRLRTAGVPVIGVPGIPLDYDNDGDLDLVGIQRSSAGSFMDYWHLVRRNSSGGLDTPVNLGGPGYASGDGHTNRFLDVTGDGLPDLLRELNDAVQVAAQQPDGLLSAAISVPQSACTGIFYLFGAVDVDRNGRNDIVRRRTCTGGGAAELTVNYSQSDGSFSAEAIIAHPAASLPVRGTVGDLDGDGAPEIVGVPPGGVPSTVLVLQVNGSGGFDTTALTLSGSYNAASNQDDIDVVDVNGDGRNDLIVGGGETFVLTQNADHSFTESARLSILGAVQDALGRFSVVDIDGDGRRDLYLKAQSNTLGTRVWHRQLADGSFVERTDLDTTVHTLFDYDLDGRADLLETRLIPPGLGPGSYVNIQADAR
jgi:hypothetical protein